MYATPYIHPDGFGSVGYLSDIRDDSITVADPIFGTVIVAPDDCFGVISTEAGCVLGGVRPALIPSLVSTQLLTEPERLVANEAQVIMLRPKHTDGDEFPSGYPHAWETIRHWREGVAPDWRTIALSAIFARNSVQRTIEEAEMLFRTFGPTIRDAILRGHPPTEAQLLRMKGIKGTRATSTSKKRKVGYSWDDIPSYLGIFEWAPWVAAQAASTRYDRRFRDAIVTEWAPYGLGIAKVSFTMMLMGRDAACIDSRMQRLFFGEYESAEDDASFDVEEIESEESGASPERLAWLKKVARRSTAKGSRGVSAGALRTYQKLENRLSKSPYFDASWPMPYARAQWMMWETLGRTAGPAKHDALWEVMGPLISDIDSGNL